MIAGIDQDPIEFTFTNKYGERWLLRIDHQTETGELTGEDLGDSTVQIANDVIQSDLMLGTDETAWLAECWEATIGRPSRCIIDGGTAKTLRFQFDFKLRRRNSAASGGGSPVRLSSTEWRATGGPASCTCPLGRVSSAAGSATG